LTDHDAVDATGIEVRVDSGEITLAGTVEDRRMKRLAEECVEGLRGVRDVHNELRIADRRPQRP
jgi:osmotically-inducible protein OsmY